MYKVFYNQKPLFFTTDLSKNSDETPLFFIKYATAYIIVRALLNKKTKAVYLYHPKEEKLKKHFLKHFPVVEAAGGLVEHTDGRYLFIYRNDKWDLPKGKIEKNEVIIDAAIREVMEETGVADIVIKRPLKTTYHVYNANGKFKLKKTYWFLMKSSYDAPLVPQEEENIQAAVWKTKTEFSALMQNAYENIKILLEEIK
ncbi:MAG: 8-oxo-dGTP pyrophosphatase MutT (NUDIX family) [Flavobacteriaceae bacterium]|jgi:8-oxo-dGTP pyrophosphatase MutT (NUDIX family)